MNGASGERAEIIRNIANAAANVLGAAVNNRNRQLPQAPPPPPKEPEKTDYTPALIAAAAAIIGALIISRR